jgi:hypothetical protein
MTLISSKRLFLVIIVCAFVHVLRIYLRGYLEDPDVGSFILMSQAFWSGEVMYRDFFDPKLPHILPLYLVSAFSGSIAGHLVVTLLTICLTGFIVTLSGKNVWGGLIYIGLTLLSPGGATGHLSVFANLIVACAYYSLTKYRVLSLSSGPRQYTYAWLFLSSGLIGYAIGLRPNYGFATVPLAIWFLWKKKVSVKVGLAWSCGCILSFLTPIIIVLTQSKYNATSLFELFRAWNRFFYSHQDATGFASRIIEMYSHPIGPIKLGILVIVYLVAFGLCMPRRELQMKIKPFYLAIAALWLSYLLSHTYNHYILMDIMIISLGVSSVRVSSTCAPLAVFICLLCLGLLLSPANGHSRTDAITIENQQKILAWIEKNNLRGIVSPMWLTPQWTTWSKVPTHGIHPEWSIGLLDRYNFKNLKVAKEFGLASSWDSQCALWESKSSVFIATQEIFDKCKIQRFRLVPEFKDAPLKAWAKES